MEFSRWFCIGILVIDVVVADAFVGSEVARGSTAPTDPWRRHFAAEAPWLLGVQLLLVGARVALLSAVATTLPSRSRQHALAGQCTVTARVSRK